MKEKNPKTAGELLKLGDKATDTYDKIDYYTQAIEMDKKFKEAYCRRGHIFRELKDFERAEHDFSDVIKIDPEYAPAYHGMGRTSCDLKLKVAALEYLGKAVKLGYTESQIVIDWIMDPENSGRF